MDEPIIDAPIESPDLEPVEAPDAPVEETPEETPTEEPKGDGRTLPPYIRAMKDVDPKAYREASSLFYRDKALSEKLKDFDLDGTRSWLDEQGGRDSIMQTLQERETKAQELDSINQAIEAGDPSVIQRFVEASPEGFAKLAPSMMQNWNQVDPDGWTRSMSGTFDATIAQSGLPNLLMKMDMMLDLGKGQFQTPEQQQIINQLAEGIKQITGWAGSFKQAATAQQTQPNQQNSKLTEREQAIAKQEQDMFSRTMTTEIDNFRTPLIESQLKDYIGRRPDDADAKQLAVDQIRRQVVERMSNDKDFTNKFQGLLNKRDKDGAMRLLRSRETTAIQDIAPKVGRTIFGNPGQAKPTAPVVQPRQVRTPQPPVNSKEAFLKEMFSK